MDSLVLGAGGFLGLNLIDQLQLTGVDFRCGSRRKAPRIALRKRNVIPVHADLDDPESLVTAMTPAHTVYHLAGHYPALSIDPSGTLALGLKQMQTVLDAAAKANVERLVYVSSTATVAPHDGGPSTERDVYTSPPEGVYHQLKWAMEALALAEHRFEVRVACPGACIGPWDQRIGTSAPLVAMANGYQPRLPNGTLNLVDVRDVATGIVALGEQKRAPSRTLLVGHNLPLLDFLGQIAERYGVAPPIEIRQEEAERWSMEEEHRAARSGVRPKLSRELVDLIGSGVSIDASLSRDALSLSYRSLEDTLVAFEAWARRRRILPKLLESAS